MSIRPLRGEAFILELDCAVGAFGEACREIDAGAFGAVHVEWDAEHDRYACLWLDSTGGGGLVNGIIGYAPLSHDRLAFLFDFGDGTDFHTTFIYDPVRDVWELRMDSERDGALKPFARATMTPPA